MMVLYPMQQYTANVHSIAQKSQDLYMPTSAWWKTAANRSLGQKDHGRHHQQRRSEV